MNLLTLYNRALSDVGYKATLTSLEEDSPAAVQCNLHYPFIRDKLLAMANWDFAARTSPLTLVKSWNGQAAVWTTAAPTPPWHYSYRYPQNAVRIRRVKAQPYLGQANVPVRFLKARDEDVDGVYLAVLTNQEQAMVTYTDKVEATSEFDVLFAEALVYALAAEIATPLMGDMKFSRGATFSGTLFDKANAIVLQARVAEANESVTTIDHVPDWIAVRDGSSSSSYGYESEPWAPLFGVK